MDSDIGHCAVLGSDDVLLITKMMKVKVRGGSGGRRDDRESYGFRREMNLGRGRRGACKKTNINRLPSPLPSPMLM